MICKKSRFLGGLIALSAVLTLIASGMLLSAGVFAPASFALAAETSFIAVEQQRDYPIRGKSASKVLEIYGEPVSKTGPVGKPPISTWQYDLFIFLSGFGSVLGNQINRKYQ